LINLKILNLKIEQKNIVLQEKIEKILYNIKRSTFELKMLLFFLKVDIEETKTRLERIKESYQEVINLDNNKLETIKESYHEEAINLENIQMSRDVIENWNTEIADVKPNHVKLEQKFKIKDDEDDYEASISNAIDVVDEEMAKNLFLPAVLRLVKGLVESNEGQIRQPEKVISEIGAKIFDKEVERIVTKKLPWKKLELDDQKKINIAGYVEKKLNVIVEQQQGF
jgi:hypothetical protein